MYQVTTGMNSFPTMRPTSAVGKDPGELAAFETGQ